MMMATRAARPLRTQTRPPLLRVGVRAARGAACRPLRAGRTAPQARYLRLCACVRAVSWPHLTPPESRTGPSRRRTREAEEGLFDDLIVGIGASRAGDRPRVHLAAVIIHRRLVEDEAGVILGLVESGDLLMASRLRRTDSNTGRQAESVVSFLSKPSSWNVMSSSFLCGRSKAPDGFALFWIVPIMPERLR